MLSLEENCQKSCLQSDTSHVLNMALYHIYLLEWPINRPNSTENIWHNLRSDVGEHFLTNLSELELFYKEKCLRFRRLNPNSQI